MLCSLLFRFPDRFACVFLRRFFVSRARVTSKVKTFAYIDTHMWSLCTCYYSIAVGFDCQKGDERIPSLFFGTFVFSSQHLSDVSPHAMTRPPNQTKDPPSRKSVTHQFLSRNPWLVNKSSQKLLLPRQSFSLSLDGWWICANIYCYTLCRPYIHLYLCIEIGAS